MPRNYTYGLHNGFKTSSDHLSASPTQMHTKSSQLQGGLDSHLQLRNSLIPSEDWIDPIYVIYVPRK